jgi:hypothetical protein
MSFSDEDSPMNRRLRSGGALAVAAGALFTMTSCDKPTPLITLQSGRTVVSSEAVLYTRDGQTAQPKPAAQTLYTRNGTTVQVSVAKDVADRGWLVRQGDTVIVSTTHDHAATFVASGLGSTPLTLTILTAPTDNSNNASGLWVFKLANSN